MKEQIDRYVDRQRDPKIDGQIDRQTDLSACVCVFCVCVHAWCMLLWMHTWTHDGSWKRLFCLSPTLGARKQRSLLLHCTCNKEPPK